MGITRANGLLVCVSSLLLLGACVSVPSSPLEAARLVSRATVSFRIWTSLIGSGPLAPEVQQRLDRAIAPLGRRCDAEGGAIEVSRTTLQVENRVYSAPEAFTCRSTNTPQSSWGADLSYRVKTFRDSFTGDTGVIVAVHAELADAAQVASRDEQVARMQVLDRAATERRAAAAAEASRAAQERENMRRSKAAELRNNLRVGDRVRVVSDGGAISRGLVVEVKRPLALVQFAASLRWIEIDHLEPAD
jgi:hypothetical protein